MSSKKKPQLPKAVLDMKFMKKTKERIQKEFENTENHDKLFSSIITNEMRHASGNFISESSFIFCEDLLEGRLSFKGMNPEIERLMDSDIKQEDVGDMQKDVSDELLEQKMSAFRKRNRPIDTPSKYICNKKRK